MEISIGSVRAWGEWQLDLVGWNSERLFHVCNYQKKNPKVMSETFSEPTKSRSFEIELMVQIAIPNGEDSFQAWSAWRLSSQCRSA